MDRQCHCDDNDESENAAFRTNASTSDPFRSCKSRSEQRSGGFVTTVGNSVEEALCPIPRCVQANREPEAPAPPKAESENQRDGNGSQNADPILRRHFVDGWRRRTLKAHLRLARSRFHWRRCRANSRGRGTPRLLPPTGTRPPTAPHSVLPERQSVWLVRDRRHGKDESEEAVR